MQSRLRIAVGIGGLLALSACAARPELAAGPDCRPLSAKVILQCWYGGADAPLSQCEVAREEPVGCGIGEAAVTRFNSGLDLSPIFNNDPAIPDRPRRVQFNVYRDQSGRIGRIYFQDDRPQIYADKAFTSK